MAINFKSGMTKFAKTMDGPPGGGPPSFEVSFDRILAIPADLSRARDKGLFVPLPTRSPTQSKDVSRIRTICDRLYKLGYMKKKSPEPIIDDNLRQGLKAFQQEAGLTVDGWAGEKETWPALQELVSFETPMQTAKWFDSSVPKPALKRAIALRLFALGIKKTRPNSANVRIKGDMRQFGKFWQMLHLGKTDGPADITPEWVDRLFDMDGLSKRLSTASKNISAETRRKVQRFIVSTAKVELWLLGYEVKPDGYDLKVSQKPKNHSNQGDLTDQDIYDKIHDPYLIHRIRIKNRLFYDALHLFWLDQGTKDGDADTLSLSFLNDFQSFFKAVDESVSEEKKWAGDDAGRKIENFVKTRRKDLPGVWERVKTMGARIWDGIRRVWGWFKRLMRKGVKKVLEIGRNMSRLIYEYTLGAFSVLSNVVKSMGATIKIIASPVMPGSDTENGRTLMLRDRDMDLKVFIDSGAEDRVVERSCQEMIYEAHKFSFGCSVIGTFIMILSEIFSKGWFGYYGLILALVKMRRYKVRFKSLVDEYRDVFLMPQVV